ncbi:MAG: RICIN domain-containing protein [Lachnospiraceae bacterium]|nr:RICIN domain-containing protein [Lachnospiraceae bacterium]
MRKRLKKLLCTLSCMAMVVTSLVTTPVMDVQAAAVTPESGNIYYIKNKNSGLYLQVENDSASSGANVCQATGTGSLGQRWILEKNSSTGYYRLHPATDMTGGISLDVANGSSANGTNIQIWENNGLSAQNFAITAADSNGGYYITTEVSGFASCLDVSGASKNSGANVLEYTKKGSANQIWYFEEAPWPSSSSSSSSSSNLISDGWYYIKNVHSGLYFDVYGGKDADFTNVQQWGLSGASHQQWYVTNQGNNYVTIKSGLSSGRMLDVYYGGTTDGTNICICSANGLDTQTFQVVESSTSGAYCLLPKHAGGAQAVDVYGWSTSSGGNINTWSYNGLACQQFVFEPVSSSSGSSSSGSTSSSTASIASNYPVQEMTFVNCSDGNYVTAGSLNGTVTANSTASDSNNWVIQMVGSDYFRIVNVATGYVLAPSGNSASSGTKVVTTGSTSNNAQYWKIVSVKSDSYSHNLNYKIVNYANTSLALTLSGSNYVLSSYTGSAAQCFRFNSYGAEGFAGYCKDMSGNEKASVIGGVLGSVVEVDTLSELQTYASGSTPYTIVITGNISASSLTKVNVGKNKTFIGSYSKHILHNIHFRNISSSGNNIYKNLTFSHDVAINENDDIQMYISDGTNFWLDHCTWSGHDMSSDTSIHANDTDKFLYVGLKASFVTVNGCYFGGHKYGLILGYPGEDGGGTYDGYPLMTIANNYFHTTITRAPGLMRYGYFHCYNNYVYNFNLGYTPYTNCTIYSEKNYFDTGSYSGVVINGSGNNSNFYDTGSYSNVSIGSLGSVSWRPSSNYGYATRNASDAKTWAVNNCGSKSSSLAYAID